MRPEMTGGSVPNPIKIAASAKALSTATNNDDHGNIRQQFTFHSSEMRLLSTLPFLGLKPVPITAVLGKEQPTHGQRDNQHWHHRTRWSHDS